MADCRHPLQRHYPDIAGGAVDFESPHQAEGLPTHSQDKHTDLQCHHAGWNGYSPLFPIETFYSIHRLHHPLRHTSNHHHPQWRYAIFATSSACAEVKDHWCR